MESLENMTMKYKFTDGKILEADSPEEFLTKMRNASYAFVPDEQEFMEDCAERGRKMGVYILTDSPYSFLSSLIECGIVRAEFPLGNEGN